MKINVSRTAAIGLVLAAGLWIGSGYLLPHETANSQAAIRANEQAPKLFRVAVMEARTERHSRKLILSGRTEADRKVMAVARTVYLMTYVPLVINGTTIEPGGYTLFIDLKENDWTFIVSSWPAQRFFDLAAQAHPDKLAVMGRLDPTRLHPVPHCRVGVGELAPLKLISTHSFERWSRGH